MKITNRFGTRLLVLMMSILLIGAGSCLAETDEPGPFQRLFRALRQRSNESHHKSATKHSSDKQQTAETESISSSDSSARADRTTTNKPPSDRNTRSATRVAGTKEKGLAYGKPVPGKSGLVTSPYSPDAGYIDVRGFAPGTPVKDPYSGKIFLTP